MKPTGTQTIRAQMAEVRKSKLALWISICTLVGLVGSGFIFGITALVEAADDRYLLRAGSITRSLSTMQANQKNFKIDSLQRDIRYFNDKIWDLEGYMEKSPGTVTSRERLRLKELQRDRKVLEDELDRVKRQ